MRTSRLLAGGLAAAATGFLFGAVVVSTAYAQDAKQIYDKDCASCHGAGGKGNGGAAKMLEPPPPQDLSVALKDKSNAYIARVIKEGGKAVGKSVAMPAQGNKLSDDQIKGLVDYIRGLHQGNPDEGLSK